MRLTRDELRKAAYDLEEDTKKICAKYEEKFVPIIKEQQQHSENNNVNSCLDIIYDCLTEVFSHTADTLDMMYSDLPDFKIDDVMKLTYAADGKTTEERVQSYWKEQSNDPNSLRLLSQLCKLLETESTVVENTIKQERIPLRATVSVIEGGCSCGDGDCDDWCGEFAPGDEPNGFPPFHPGCNCVQYYEETDDFDDINDLDLEVEEVEPIDIVIEEE